MIIKEGVVVRFGADMRGLKKGLKDGKKGIATFAAAGAIALASLTLASTKMAADFEKSVRLIGTLTGATENSMKRMGHELKEIARETGKDVNELGAANYQAVSGGFTSIKESMDLVRSGTKLSIASNAELVTSTELVVKTLKAYGKGADEAEKTSAQLWGATRDGIVTVSELGRFMTDLPTAFRAADLSLGELGAGIATLTATGLPMAKAVDQMRAAVIKLETQGITGSFVERIEKFAGKGLPEMMDLFGDQGAALGVLALATNVDLLKVNVEKSLDVTEDYDKAVDIMEGGALSKWERTQQNLNTMLIGFGEKILPKINTELELLNALMAPGAGKGFAPGEGMTFGTPEGTVDLSGGFGIQRGPGPPDLAPTPLGPGEFDIFPTAPAPSDGQPLQPGFGQDQFTLARFPTPTANPDIPFRPIDGLEDEAPLQGLELLSAGIKATDRELAELAKTMKKSGEGSSEFNAQATVASMAITGVAGALMGPFLSAMNQSESAVTRFVGSLLAQMARLAAGRLATRVFAAISTGGASEAFQLPGTQIGRGFALGGPTGSTGGTVHKEEFVFDANAVRNIGLGPLERAQAIGSAGGPLNLTLNQTNGAGVDGNQIARQTTYGVQAALREARITRADKLFAKATLGGGS